jgi:pimeloyl-ACP methyl ester carboxylesterase
MQVRVASLAAGAVRYVESGTGSTTLVLLHAFPLSADQWLPQLYRTPPGWRVIAPDLRGFRGAVPPAAPNAGFADLTRASGVGRGAPTSERARRGAGDPADQSIDNYANDVVAFMTALSIERAVVAGLSMGGYVAMAMARTASRA